MENHIDFTAREILQLIEDVGSTNFGVNFDTGNALRLFAVAEGRDRARRLVVESGDRAGRRSDLGIDRDRDAAGQEVTPAVYSPYEECYQNHDDQQHEA